MHYNIKLFEELEVNADVDWWNENREKVNEAIRMCNDWQTNHKQDRYFAELSLAKINSIRRWNDGRGDRDLNEWQIEILDEIEEHITSVINNED